MQFKRAELVNKAIGLVRGNKVRLGVITSVGPKKIGARVLGMKTRTSIPVDGEETLFPITIYVTKEVLSELEPKE
jgi:hypothetical protein